LRSQLLAEADFQWSGQNDSLCRFVPSRGCAPVIIDTFRSSRLDWFGTVRGVVGVAQDNWLWTITGGYAYGNVVDQAGGFQLGNGQNAFDSDRVTLHGWTIGAGVETRLPASNWSVKLEYLYIDLGTHTFHPVCAGFIAAGGPGVGCPFPQVGVPPPVSTSFTDHVVRVGLNYNLGGSRQASTPAPRPAAAPAPANWAGFYAGGNIGYGVGHDRLDIERIRANGTVASVWSFPQSPGGIIGGGQAGYRFQYNWFVIGAEADFQWSKQKDSSCTGCVGTAINYEVKRDWFGTVRGVAGVAQGNWLWYVTGGYAYGRVAIDHNISLAGFEPILASLHSTERGWTGGVGVETKLWASNWSVRLEYLYIDLGEVSFDGICPAGTAPVFGLMRGRCEAVTSSITDHVIRVGLNYRFGS
jgi:outer membrane immunogenic protein